MPRLREWRWDTWADHAHCLWLEDTPDVVAVDTETTGLGFHDLAFCATLTWRRPSGSGETRSFYIDLEEEGWRERGAHLSDILSGTRTWVFHNAKFDLQKLDYLGLLPPLEGHQIDDTQPLASLLNENRRLALKSLAITELGIEDVVEVVTKSGPNKGKSKPVPRDEHALGKARRALGLTKDDGYHLLPRDVLARYAMRDTELTLLLWERLRPQLPADLEGVYAEELEVARILRKLESNGVGIDVEYLDEAADEWGVKSMETWQALVGAVGREDFNPNSPQQVKVAFAASGVTLESTDKAHLRDLIANKASPKGAVKLAEALREYRDVEKIYGTYLKPLQKEQRNGIAHPWFSSVGPRTGRTSSGRATN